MPKIISECCELVKLCDINCSGPVILRHTAVVVVVVVVVVVTSYRFVSDASAIYE